MDTSQLRGKVGVDYARVSSTNDASPDQQQRETARDADDLGIRIVARYRENGAVSASGYTTKKRDEWEKVVAHLATGEVEVLIVWEISRADRKAHVWATLVHECEQRGVYVYVTSHGAAYDPRNRRDWKTLMDEGTSADYASRETSDRTRRGILGALEAGIPHGPIPYGYRREYIPGSQIPGRKKPLPVQKIDPEKAGTVREIFTRLGAGHSIRAIRNDLNANGIPSPKGGKWQQHVIRGIAFNPAYIAKRRHNGNPEMHNGNWPAILAGEEGQRLWYDVVRRLSDHTRRTSRDTRTKYLLSAWARCGKCGSVLHVVPNPTQGRQPYYLCGDKSCVSITMAALDEHVTAIVIDRLSRPDVFEALRKSDDSAVVSARREIAELRQRLAEWEEAAGNGEVTPAAFGRIEAKIIPRITAAERRIEQATVPVILRDLPSGDVAEWWEKLTIVAKREVIKLLLNPVIVNGVGKHSPRGFNPDRIVIEWKQS